MADGDSADFRHHSLRKKTGFTLIELLVVISIIALLSSIVLAALNSARARARDAKRESDIHQIQVALEEYYYSNNDTYPPSGGATQPNNGWSNSNDSSWATLGAALQPYLPAMPADPVNTAGNWPGGGAYSYAYYSLGYGCPQKWYMIVWRPETAINAPSPGVTACDGTFFNYGGGGYGSAITVGNTAP